VVYVEVIDGSKTGSFAYFGRKEGVLLVLSVGKLYQLETYERFYDWEMLEDIGWWEDEFVTDVFVFGSIDDVVAPGCGWVRGGFEFLSVGFGDGLVLVYSVRRSFDVVSLLEKRVNEEAVEWLLKLLGLGDVEAGRKKLVSVFGRDINLKRFA